jgi:hypothetical protein
VNRGDGQKTEWNPNCPKQSNADSVVKKGRNNYASQLSHRSTESESGGYRYDGSV